MDDTSQLAAMKTRILRFVMRRIALNGCTTTTSRSHDMKKTVNVELKMVAQKMPMMTGGFSKSEGTGDVTREEIRDG